MGRHKISAHDKVTYPCDQCDASAFFKVSSLRKHKGLAHMETKYSCDKCDASPFTHINSLRKHKESVHSESSHQGYQNHIVKEPSHKKKSGTKNNDNIIN